MEDTFNCQFYFNTITTQRDFRSFIENKSLLSAIEGVAGIKETPLKDKFHL